MDDLAELLAEIFYHLIPDKLRKIAEGQVLRAVYYAIAIMASFAWYL